MSREIKFRAWVKEVHENDEYAYGGYMIEPHKIKKVYINNATSLMNGPSGTGIGYFEQGSLLPGMGSLERLKFNEIELMQYTGLKDKNDKEICEGDIVQYKHYYAIKRWWRNMNEIPEIEKQVQEQRDNYVIEKQHIVFANGGFYLGYDINGRDIDRGEKYQKGSGNTSDFEEKCWDFEVIGNIYENPELIQS